MCGILGLIEGDRLTLWRVVDGRPVQFAAVEGSKAKIERALAYARELDVLATGLGGWAKVFGLRFNPPEPRHLVKVAPRIVAQDDLDSRLGKV